MMLRHIFARWFCARSSFTSVSFVAGRVVLVLPPTSHSQENKDLREQIADSTREHEEQMQQFEGEMKKFHVQVRHLSSALSLDWCRSLDSCPVSRGCSLLVSTRMLLCPSAMLAACSSCCCPHWHRCAVCSFLPGERHPGEARRGRSQGRHDGRARHGTGPAQEEVCHGAEGAGASSL
jgi:hypothetical protein